MRFQADSRLIPYSEFLADVKAGKVAEVVIGNELIQGTLKEPPNPASGSAKAPTGPGKAETTSRQFSTVRVDDPTLAQRLGEEGVRFRGVRENSWFGTVLSWVFPLLM